MLFFLSGHVFCMGHRFLCPCFIVALELFLWPLSLLDLLTTPETPFFLCDSYHHLDANGPEFSIPNQVVLCRASNLCLQPFPDIHTVWPTGSSSAGSEPRHLPQCPAPPHPSPRASFLSSHLVHLPLCHISVKHLLALGTG